ncbi:MAG: outer membrane beta-barrel protein, partial [Gemmatimonadetes bacterium]|nr:outer membrane beta-barrel protein [Gemmatimonadota bacterium]
EVMKRLFALLAVFFLSAAPAHAQGLEFSGGVNFSKLSQKGIEDAARKVGMNFGVDFVIPVGPLGLNLGADWSQKGVENAIDAVTSSSIDLSYIELPIHLRFPLVGAGPIRLNLVLGPTFGINTGCEITTDVATAEACADFANGFDPKKVDVSGTGGLGVSLGLGGIAYAVSSSPDG